MFGNQSTYIKKKMIRIISHHTLPKSQIVNINVYKSWILCPQIIMSNDRFTSILIHHFFTPIQNCGYQYPQF